jgi:hemolysin III
VQQRNRVRTVEAIMYHTKHIFPSYTRLEHFADTCVHVAGLLFSVAATVFLLAAALRPLPAADIAGLIVYCIGLMGMFAASAAYNLVSHHEIKEILRRLDHSAIFVMIAGSYTPFAIVVGGAAGGFMLAAVWAIAVIGVGLKLRFPRRFDKLTVLLYLVQGWLVVLAIGPVAASLPSQALWLLVIGGIVYTAGVPFHLMEWMRFHNAIWHLFVLGGAACQFVAIKGAVIQV